MDVSIILCTAHRAAFLRDTLASLAGVQVPEGWQCELLVVDNASTDDTQNVVAASVLPRLTVRCVRETRPGKGFAYNRGLAEARGSILLFTDDDVRFPANWIGGMAAPIRSGRADAVAGGVRIAPLLERGWLTPGHAGRLASTETLSAAAPGEMVGANMAFSRDVLKLVPAFDTFLGPGALGFGDDTLFAWQVLEAGFRLVSAFDVCVEHHFDPERLTRASLLAAAQKTGRTQGWLHRHWEHKHPPLPRLRLLFCLLRLAAWRALHPRALFQSGCASQAELDSVRAVSVLQQYLAERKRPPRYARRGLKPNHADPASTV